jgi:hypothetical protein
MVVFRHLYGDTTNLSVCTTKKATHGKAQLAQKAVGGLVIIANF